MHTNEIIHLFNLRKGVVSFLCLLVMFQIYLNKRLMRVETHIL